MVLMLLSPNVLAVDTTLNEFGYQTRSFDWMLRKSKRDIKIYSAKVSDSKYKAILSVMTVKAPIETLVALLTDLDNCSKWAAMCKEAKTLSRVSRTESIVYSLNDAPFPVRDRDVVAKVNWSINSETQKVSMVSRAIVSPLNLKKGVVRVRQAVSEWHFTPQESGETLVENFAHINPNGTLPAWVMNLLVIESPFRTFKKMRSTVESGKYDNAVVPFLSNKTNIKAKIKTIE